MPVPFLTVSTAWVTPRTTGWLTPRAAALVTASWLAACTPAPPAEEPIRAVRTTVVSGGKLALQHEYAAEIRARTESRLSFRVGGKMTLRLVNAGDSVKAGQVLARLDAQDLNLGQDAAQAALLAAKANLDVTETEFKRYQELRAQGFISSLELDRREASLKSARAQVQQLRAQAGVQTNQAAYAVLTADRAGVITGVDAEPGAVLSPGTPVLRLAHDGPRDAWFSVPEDRVAPFRALLGKAGGVTLRAWGDEAKDLPATVREVSAAADPATRTFAVKADVGAAKLRLGQTATVLVGAPVVAGVVKLPLPAVFELSGIANVWLLDLGSMTVRAQPVAIGGAEGNLVVIAAGLSTGQTVVTAGVHTLVPGQKVKRYVEPQVMPTPTGQALAAMPAASTR